MRGLKEVKCDIAASLFMMPCSEKELHSRDFVKGMAFYSLQRILQYMENDGIIRYEGNIIHTNKSWAKKNLKDYELDFRTEKQKLLDSMTPFAKEVYKLTKL